MGDNKTYPYLAFNFRVVIDGIGGGDAYFQEVSGISAELQFDTVNAGAENNYQLKLPTRTKYPNLVLKRGTVDASSELLKWCSDAIFENSNLSKFNNSGANIKRDVTVHLKNDKGIDVLSWAFIDCYPVKWEMSGFNAQKSEISLETIEIAYKYFKYFD